MSEGKIIEIYNQGISQVIGVIKELSSENKALNSQVETLSKENKALTKRIKLLESQVNKNSNNNSSKPHRQMALKLQNIEQKLKYILTANQKIHEYINN
ncbi:hypothetical protein [Clostridium sp. UBA871]|uniref:hypothetical protein n=1 Tax=Clostridium sp. UBA871 TaxID=1946380 RepID=UPI00321632E3